MEWFRYQKFCYQRGDDWVQEVSVGQQHYHWHILLWCDKKDLVLILFTCVCESFQTYRVYSRFDKCDFLKNRVEYVGHDILCRDNTLAQSIFNLLNDWALPDSGQSLFSFMGLANFYHCYASYMEMKLKSLRVVVKSFFSKPIQKGSWIPKLINFFADLKLCITSSPVLA